MFYSSVNRGLFLKSVAVVDLSWDMHRNKEALSMLSVQKVRTDGTYWILPTGHVYGTWQDVLSLSQRYDLVILAVDSPNYKRKELMSSYKADRHTHQLVTPLKITTFTMI